MSTALSASQKRHLRGLAHALKPVILIGARGPSDAVLAELEGALERHELLKLKVAAEDRETRDAWIEEMARRAGAAVVQRVGHVATLYRRSRDKPRIELSD